MPRVKPLRTFESVLDHAVKTKFPATRSQVLQAKRVHFERSVVQRKRGSLFRGFHQRIHAGFFPREYRYLGRLTQVLFDDRIVSGTIKWKSVIGKCQNGLIRRKMVRTRAQAILRIKKDAAFLIGDISAKLSVLEEKSKQGLLSEREKIVRNGYRTHGEMVVSRLKRLIQELNNNSRDTKVN